MCLTYKKLDGIIKVQKEKEERTMAKVIKKHFDKEQFKWLTNEEYCVIIEKEKLSSTDITARFRTYYTLTMKGKEE